MFCFYKVLLIHEEREKQLSKEQTYILQEPHCLLQQQQQQFTYIILVTPKMYSQLTKFPATKKKNFKWVLQTQTSQCQQFEIHRNMFQVVQSSQRHLNQLKTKMYRPSRQLDFKFFSCPAWDTKTLQDLTITALTEIYLKIYYLHLSRLIENNHLKIYISYD